MKKVDVKEQIEQIKLNCLSTKKEHTLKLKSIKRPSAAIDIIIMSITIIHFPIRYLSKGTALNQYVEMEWEISAAILFILSLLRYFSSDKWQDEINTHNKLISQNIDLVTDANNMLSKTDIDDDFYRFFITKANNLEKEDTQTLGEANIKDKQWAYREALKEFDPRNTNPTCPRCQSSVWDYKKPWPWQKTCATCGIITN